MQRLVDWYRIGSSSGAVAALLLANAIPLVGVLLLGWNVFTILTIYWLENGVVGAFNILKMARAEGLVPLGDLVIPLRETPVMGVARVVMIPFFILHYGLFWVIHGVFVLNLPVIAGGGTGFFELGGGLPADPAWLLITLAGLVISHGLSYRLNYIGRGEYRRATIGGQMFAPYGRLVILHVTIIVGGMAIAFLGAPVAAIVVLVILKTAADLGLHLAEHRPRPVGAAMAPRTWTSG